MTPAFSFCEYSREVQLPLESMRASLSATFPVVCGQPQCASVPKLRASKPAQHEQRLYSKLRGLHRTDFSVKPVNQATAS